MKIRGPGQSSLLLLKVIKLLNKRRVPYAIVGAFAASFYGVVRASLDADAVISLGDDEDIEDVLGALQVSPEKIDRHLLKHLTLHYGKKELIKLEKILRSPGPQR